MLLNFCQVGVVFIKWFFPVSNSSSVSLVLFVWWNYSYVRLITFDVSMFYFYLLNVEGENLLTYYVILNYSEKRKRSLWGPYLNNKIYVCIFSSHFRFIVHFFVSVCSRNIIRVNKTAENWDINWCRIEKLLVIEYSSCIETLNYRQNVVNWYYENLWQR